MDSDAGAPLVVGSVAGASLLIGAGASLSATPSVAGVVFGAGLCP